MRAFALSVLVAISVGEARAEIYGTLYRSREWRVELSAPKDWALSEQASYPGILVVGSHKNGGRLSLAVQSLRPGESLRDYTDRNEKALRKIGYTISGVSTRQTGAIVLDATSADKKKRIRQGYLGLGTTAYVLTLAAPTETMPSLLSAFDFVLTSITFEELPRPDAGPNVQ